MHLLFYGREQVKILGTKSVETFLRDQTEKVGGAYSPPPPIAYF